MFIPGTQRQEGLIGSPGGELGTKDGSSKRLSQAESLQWQGKVDAVLALFEPLKQKAAQNLLSGLVQASPPDDQLSSKGAQFALGEIIWNIHDVVPYDLWFLR